MKPILLVIDELEVGGSQRQVLLLARAFLRMGHAVTVAYFREAGAVLRPEFEAAGATVELIAKRRGVDPSFYMRLARFLASHRDRWILSFGYTANLWTRLAGGSASISCIRNFEYVPRPWMGRVERLLAGRSRRVVANSRRTANIVVERGWVPAEKILVIPNAVESEPPAARESARARLRAGGEPIVGTLARLVEPKDLPTLLRAAKRVIDRRPEVRFVIGGEGPLRDRLLALRNELRLDERVLFPGTLPGREVITGFDVAVLTSSTEGMPNFVLEAMAAGVPLVATRAGAAAELLDEGRLGHVVDVGDDGAVAEGILAVLADPATAQAIAKSAQEKVAALTADHIAAQYLALFE